MAPLAGVLAGRLRMHPGWVAATVPAGVLLATVVLTPAVLGGQAVRLSLAWLPHLDIRYALHLDGLALLFSILIAGVGLLILIYSAAYMPRERELGRFYAMMLLFMGSMLGVVLADDLVLLYVFWELTSLTSFFLIGYRNEDPAARAGAVQAFIVTTAGGVAMLAGLVLLAQSGGTWQISELLERAGTIQADGRYPAILMLLLLGAFTKSAQVPFQFWLPSAMVAPTPVSAYLHAATMVWAGVYLLARLLPVLGGTPLWTGVVTAVGLATLLAGAGLALVQTHLKALLAYSTVGALGLATALLGRGTPEGAAAAMVWMLNHAAFKGALFLVAGIVEHETGAREVWRVSGLRRTMPLTFALAIVAVLSMAGIPPLGGFLSKEAAFDAFLPQSWPAAAAVVISGALALAYGARFLRVFLDPRPQTGRPAGHRMRNHLPAASPAGGHAVSAARGHDPSAVLWGPTAVLAALAVAFGLAPGVLEPLAALVAEGIGGIPHPVTLWHGLGWMSLTVTGLSVAAGAGLLRAEPLAHGLAEAMRPLSTGRLYDGLAAGTLQAARALTGAYMTGRLRNYLVYIVGTTLVLVATGLVLTGVAAPLGLAGLESGPTVAVLVAMTAAVAATRLQPLLGAVLALGTVGYTVSLIYLFLSAPDIAITQTVIETVSLVLFVAAIVALAGTDAEGARPRSLTNGILALAAGAVSAVLAILVADVSRMPRVSEEFLARAAEAGGRNVVNLVVVDFRGWDTLGEISVLVIAALGIMALVLRKARPVRRGADAAPMTSPILRVVATLASPIIVAYALFLWATGHYSPGGGFVGGLMIAAALVLRVEAFGGGRLRRRWDRLMALGLLIAAAEGLIPLLFGRPPLKHALLHVGTLHVSTSLIFDLGVLLVVIGAVMSAIRALVETG